ncbi:threonine/serine exporter family protein [Beduinella massiliensis]|uniref:threonine/serine exporter family protein n=1 Tax=Beduinella massiliensis TaxID=1852363 RepID=UPI000C8165F2
MSDEKVALRALCLAARIILENGGETYRVEETVMRMAGGLGLREARVVAFPTSLFVTLGTRTITLRVARRGTDLSRLASANDISRHVALGHMDAAEAERALLALAASPAPAQPLLIAASGVCAAMFALMFRGSPAAALVALLTGALSQAVAPCFSKLEMSQLVTNAVGGFLTAFIAVGLNFYFPYHTPNAAIAGGIMPLLSGLLMTNAMRDTMYGDLVSGVSRAVEALLIAATVACGVFVALKFWALFGGL